MPDPKPSWQTSTLTLMAIWSLVTFTLAAAAVGWKVAHGMDKETATIILSPFVTILTGFGMSYLTARKPGNGQPPEPPVEKPNG